jgi:hypothetical protein
MKYWKEILIVVLLFSNAYLYANRTTYKPEIKVEFSDRTFPSELKLEGNFAQPIKRIYYKHLDTVYVDTTTCMQPTNFVIRGYIPENYATYKGNNLRITYFDPEKLRFVQEDFALITRTPDNLLSASVGLRYYDFTYQKRLWGGIYGGGGIALVNGKVYPHVKLTLQF